MAKGVLGSLVLQSQLLTASDLYKLYKKCPLLRPNLSNDYWERKSRPEPILSQNPINLMIKLTKVHKTFNWKEGHIVRAFIMNRNGSLQKSTTAYYSFRSNKLIQLGPIELKENE